MRSIRLLQAIALAGQLALAADPKPRSGGSSVKDSGVPPVLRNREPGDDRVVMLPGSPPAPEAATPVAAAKNPPSPAAAPLMEPAKPAAVAPPPVGRPQPAAAVRKAAAPARAPTPMRPKPSYPSEFEEDSAAYCQKRIGQWTEMDARGLLGQPVSRRPSYAARGSEDGRILAFRDPSGRHQRLELDFSAATGRLRTVFIYPWDMWWSDCVRLWGRDVTAAAASQGRTFYSYTNHRVDVLAEPSGRVVSLGLY